MRSVLACLVGLVFLSVFVGSAGTVRSWVDAEGHLWVSSDVLEWDISHGSSFVVTLGSEARDWRHYTDTYQYGAYLGSGGNAQHSPGYARTRDSDPVFGDGQIVNQPDGSTTFAFENVMTHDEYEYPLAHRLTFYQDSGLIRVDYSVDNVTTDPNPPGFEYQFSLTPGGDKAGDYYYYSGKDSEAPYPYGAWDAIYSNEMGSVTGYSYITVYDKGAMQGLAMIARTSELADWITDMNYGVAEISDTTHYSNFSHAQLCMNSVLDSSFFYLVYEYDPGDPYGPIEDAIHAIANGEVPMYVFEPIPDPPEPDTRPSLEERLAEKFGVSPGVISMLLDQYGRFNVRRAAIGSSTREQLMLALEGITVEGLGPGGKLAWQEGDQLRMQFLATTATGTPIAIPTASVSIMRGSPGAGCEVVGCYTFGQVGNEGRHSLSIAIDSLEPGTYTGYIESAMFAIEVPISFVIN